MHPLNFMHQKAENVLMKREKNMPLLHYSCDTCDSLLLLGRIWNRVSVMVASDGLKHTNRHDNQRGCVVCCVHGKRIRCTSARATYSFKKQKNKGQQPAKRHNGTNGEIRHHQISDGEKWSDNNDELRTTHTVDNKIVGSMGWQWKGLKKSF